MTFMRSRDSILASVANWQSWNKWFICFGAISLMGHMFWFWIPLLLNSSLVGRALGHIFHRKHLVFEEHPTFRSFCWQLCVSFLDGALSILGKVSPPLSHIRHLWWFLLLPSAVLGTCGKRLFILSLITSVYGVHVAIVLLILRLTILLPWIFCIIFVGLQNSLLSLLEAYRSFVYNLSPRGILTSIFLFKFMPKLMSI